MDSFIPIGSTKVNRAYLLWKIILTLSMLSVSNIAVVKNMFRFELLIRSYEGYLFLKSGHRIFPDRYHTTSGEGN